MQHDRRQFLGTLTTGAMALGGLGLGLAALPEALSAAMPSTTGPQGSAWDTRWPSRLTGRIRTVFDVPEVESGYGVWRASIWAAQYRQVLGIAENDLSTALVLRHNGIVLALQQSAWDRWGLGAHSQATHPGTGQPTPRNPALMGTGDGLAEVQASFALPEFIKRGGVVLACDLAMNVLSQHVAKVASVSTEVAKQRLVESLVPGVILQPSGVFAVLHAQREAGALYIRAS